MLCLTFIGQVPSHLNAVVKTTKISKPLQATQGDPARGAVTLSSQFSTVQCDVLSAAFCDSRDVYIEECQK